MRSLRINGLKLPDQLVELLEKGKWVPPDYERLAQIFGEKEISSESPQFYSIEYMPLENKGWYNQTMPEYLGIPDSENPPGDVDPHQSVLIGDLGVDLPFALDYRECPENPRVIFLGLRIENRWITVAKDFQEFANALGL